MADPTYYNQPTGTATNGQQIYSSGAGTPPPAPAPTPTSTPSAPTSPTPSPYYSRYTPQEQQAADYLATPVKEQSVEDIQAQKTKDAQGQIDALNQHYEDLLRQQQTVNEGRDRSTNAVSTLSGLAGSSEAAGAANTTTALNAADTKKIQDEKAAAIQDVFTQIRTSAETQARQSRLDARQSAQDILDQRTKNQAEATQHLTTLAQSGVTAEGLKQSDPQSYDYFVKHLGSESDVKALITLNRPTEDVMDKRVENGKYIIAYRNPLTGATRIESIDLGIPQGYSKTIDAGDRILAIPDNWDGSPDKLITINKGLTPSEKQKASDNSGDEQLYNGLSAHTSTAIRARVNKYASDNTIQNYSTVQDGYNFAKSLSADTKNPADDQALIYSLAKALDPGSVVREGEYATAQKYSQSWVAAYGTGISQALLGTGFLSKTARENIKKTIEEKYNSQKLSYDQTRGSYIQGINALTGRSDGEKFLTEFTTPNNAPGATGSKVLSKDGQSFDATDLTPEEYQQAIQDGYVAQ